MFNDLFIIFYGKGGVALRYLDVAFSLSNCRILSPDDYNLCFHNNFLFTLSEFNVYCHVCLINMYNHDLGKTQCWFTLGIGFVSADQIISEQKVLNNRTTN